MRSRRWVVVVATAAALGAVQVHAQQTEPERARAFAALPNWTGLWETELSAALSSGELFPKQPAPPAAAAPPDATGGAPPVVADPFVALLLERVNLLRHPAYRGSFEAEKPLDSAAAARPSGPAPTQTIVCKWGFPAIVESPVPDGMFEALITPEETLFLFRDGEVRHVYTDGRSHPAKEDLWPTAMGDSVGHWDGNTLLIDTIARKAGAVFPIPLPGVAQLSDQAHFSERFRRIDANTMADDLTIEDPARFADPWRLAVTYKRVTDLDRMIHTDCVENERNVVVDGKMTIAPR